MPLALLPEPLYHIFSVSPSRMTDPWVASSSSKAPSFALGPRTALSNVGGELPNLLLQEIPSSDVVYAIHRVFCQNLPYHMWYLPCHLITDGRYMLCDSVSKSDEMTGLFSYGVQSICPATGANRATMTMSMRRKRFTSLKGFSLFSRRMPQHTSSFACGSRGMFLCIMRG